MTDKDPNHSDPGPLDEQRAQLQQAMEGMSTEQIATLAQQILASAGGTGASPAEMDAPPPSRRRPPREEVATYQVRVDIVDAAPPIWRRLELASDLFLDDVHEIMQAAFGWTDSHLHRFGVGPHIWDRDTDVYLCPFEVDEGDSGTPAAQVRLDEVLVESGDVLRYLYDFGDDWEHTLTLETVRPRGAGDARVRCTDGRRAGPPEDCGGIHGYQEMLEAKDDPDHPDHAFARETAQAHGRERVDPARFDQGEVDEALAALGATVLETPRDLGTQLPEPLADLLHRCRSPQDRRLATQIQQAGLDEPVRVDSGTAAAMVHPFTWLLDRVGDGLKLTAAGYLPPVHVEATMDMLRPRHEWIGKANREDQTYPVMDLRENAQRLGLLRKAKGRLLVTKRGKTLRGDPVALWWHLAERLPLAARGDYRFDGGLLELLRVASPQSPPEREGRIGSDLRVLSSLGWRPVDGGPLTDQMAAAAIGDTVSLLAQLGGYEPDDGLLSTQQPTAEGRALARAALATWPGAGS